MRGRRVRGVGKRWRALGSASVAVVVACTAGAVPSAAAAPTMELSFAPSEGPPGTVFAISGACINDGPPATSVQMDVYSAESNEEQFPNITVAPDGTFTGSVTLHSAGRYRVVANCQRTAMDPLGATEQILRVEDPANPLPISVVRVFIAPIGSPASRARLSGQCLVEDQAAEGARITLSRPALADGSPRFERTVTMDIEIDGQLSAEPVELPDPSDGRYTADLECLRGGAVVASAQERQLIGTDVPEAPVDGSSTTSTTGATASSATVPGTGGSAWPAAAVAGSPSYTG